MDSKSIIPLSMRRVPCVPLTFSLLLLAACWVGCHTPVSPLSVAPALQIGLRDLAQHVGQRVELEGIVTNTKCPQVEGVDAWGLEDYRGRTVRITGVLRKSVVKETDINPMVANRGAGTFYSLKDMKYEVLQ